MNYAEFSTAIAGLAPGRNLEAVLLWSKFAAECVERGQFVHFEPETDKTSAAEKWLDVLYAGFCAVKENFGQEMAVAVIDLSREHCCLYPGEMMQAAACLERGGNAQQILDMIEAGDIDCSDLFSPISQQKSEEAIDSTKAGHTKSVVAQLKNQPQPGRRKTAPKKSAEREI